MNSRHPISSLLSLFAAAAVFLVAPAFSQTYPDKPVRLIVPWGAGGTSDTPWRIIGPKLAEALGQSVVIENRPGAAGTIGAAAVAVARPDGYTLMGTSNVLMMSASVYKGLPYNAIEDFEPVAQISRTCSALVVHPSFPARTAKEFIDYARSNPGKIDFASTGNGSGQHLFMASLASASGITLIHVPYKNVAQEMADLLAGHVKTAIPGVSIVTEHVKAGRLRALGVTCAQPSEFMPGVPTLADAAVPGFDANLRDGLFVPKGTPKDIVRRLEAELGRILQMPEIQAQIRRTTTEPLFAPSDRFRAGLVAEYHKWNSLVRELSIRAE